MTTYTLNGFLTSGGSAKLEIVVGALFDVSYTITNANTNGLPEVDLSPVSSGNSEYGLLLNGQSFAGSGTTLYAGEATWGAGKVTQLFIIEFDGVENVFVVGGDPITDLDGFNDSITGFGSISSGPLQPGAAFTYADFGNVVVSENDNVVGVNVSETFKTGQGKDTVVAKGGDDSVDGGKGDDVIQGGKGDDDIEGGKGADELFGGSGADDLFGENGNDTLYGGGGFDTLDGGDGQDAIHGDDGEDSINGNLGNDTLFGGEGNDIVKGGTGEDYVEGGKNDDELNGGSDNDTLLGGKGKDTLNGGSGKDTLDGENGHDTINGGGGNDKITGGSGNDVMSGGSGADDFIFADGFGKDVITDFNTNSSSEDIDLSDVSLIDDYTDLVDNHMSQSGNDVVITVGDDRITIEDVTLADLTADNFIF